MNDITVPSQPRESARKQATRPARRISYLIKLLLLLIGLVAVLEVISYVATRIVIHNAVTQNAKAELLSGGGIFTRLMQNKAEQLALSVAVLTDDFGFKDAVTSADENTIRSALNNHAARVKADIGIVLTAEGQLIASRDLPGNSIAQFAELRTQVEQKGRAYNTVVLDGKAYQFVLSQVKAPMPVGIAGMGFEIKQEFSEELKKLTNLDVSFVQYRQQKMFYLAGTIEHYDRGGLEKGLNHSVPGKVFEYDQLMSLAVPIGRPDNELIAVLQMPLSKVLAPFSALNLQLLVLALLFSLVAGICAFWLARSVTRPVSLLASIAQRIARGFYSTPIEVKSNDELGDLAAAFLSMQRAIAQREQQVIYQSEHDTLTSLPNRSRVFPELSIAIEKARTSAKGFSVLLVDVRNFAQFNDELSHEIGDLILHEVGANLAHHFRHRGSVLRFGSDEFLCIVEQFDQRAPAELADSVHQLFKAPVTLGQIQINIEVNIGVANYPFDADTAEILLRRTQLALNHGRANARSTCCYEQGWDEKHLRRLHLFREFETSLRDNHISLYYQPKINLDNPASLGAEALVRWNHPQMGFIPPDEFITVIESSGQITLLTRWVLREAVQQLKQLLDAHLDITLSVNLSALDLLVDDLPEYVADLLAHYKVPAANLCLEITESAIMREAEQSLANLLRLEAVGVMLSIDDFGTGYSSLSQLKKLPVSELKIDKSFIMNLASSEDDMLIVRSTIELGHTMGLSVTAEGVETEAIKNILVTYGCDTAQGYLYSKPLPATAFVEWLDKYLAGVTQGAH